MGDRRPWAIADTAESAVADDEHFASLAMFMKVSAHVGDRGFNFEYANGVLKVSVFPASKVNLLTRAAGADLALLLPRRRPRTSPALRSTRLLGPSRHFRRQLSTPRSASPRSSTNLALLTRRGTSHQRRRGRRAANSAHAAAPAASLPPLPPSKPCAEAADPPAAGLREAVALPPGLDASSAKRRVDFEAAAPSLKRVAADLRPSSVQLGQDPPAPQSLPAALEPIHCQRMPYLRAVRSAHRIPASPYARATTSRARTRLMQSKATISTAPSPSTPT